MNTIYPVATLGDQALIVNRNDVPFIGKERALEVMCIQVDFRHTKIYPPIELEKHLKFNPWNEMDDRERDETLKKLQTTFSPKDITEQIEEPLAKTLIQ